jgi:hypothetical protein
MQKDNHANDRLHAVNRRTPDFLRRVQGADRRPIFLLFLERTINELYRVGGSSRDAAHQLVELRDRVRSLDESKQCCTGALGAPPYGFEKMIAGRREVSLAYQAAVSGFAAEKLAEQVSRMDSSQTSHIVGEQDAGVRCRLLDRSRQLRERADRCRKELGEFSTEL